MNLENVEEILAKYEHNESQIISILQDVQVLHNYLPAEVLKYVAERLNMPLARAYSIASFYKAFSLEPRGEHLIRVCLGTACHVRGGPRILETTERILGIKADETTTDYKFTLKSVNCLGCCALGPVMVVDDEYYGKLPPAKVEKILHNYGYSSKEEKHD
jgi:NADH-quinone oxidoreductase subunit E